MISELSNNLKINCCEKKIIHINKISKTKTLTRVKLFDKIIYTSEENENFQWYLLSEIHSLNIYKNRKAGIICHNLEEENTEKK
jgi:hypothetical protein